MTRQQSVRFTLAGAATLALLLSGCAGLPGYPAATDAPVARLVADVDCQAPNLNFNEMIFPDGASTQTDLTSTHPDAPEPGTVPTDFEPIAVLWLQRAGTRLDSPIQVELDGCQRLFGPASEALVSAQALLAALIG